MGLDQYAHLRGKDINFEKVYNSDDYDPKEDGFVWPLFSLYPNGMEL